MFALVTGVQTFALPIFRTAKQALQLLAMFEYRAVISDMNRHGRPLAGLELVREMRQRQDDTPFFLDTVVPSEAQQVFLAEAGGQAATATPDAPHAAKIGRAHV